VRRHRLDDGRELVVIYQGENYLWGAYIPGDSKRPTNGDTPAKAIIEHLGFIPGQEPAWVSELSEAFEEDLQNAPRYVCDCCDFRTLLTKGFYDICPVCRWEDDPSAGPDRAAVNSGPNHMSLLEGRENYRRLGASDERRIAFTRKPSPEERN
jgi:hypothetical protein